MNPIKIENIDNIADIYILRKKMNNSMLYPFVILIFGFTSTILYELLSVIYENHLIIKNTINTGFGSILVIVSFILFYVAVIIWWILCDVVTINAMNRAIAFFTFINEQQYLKKSKFQKKIYIFSLFSPILVVIPLISIVVIIIPIINLCAWCAIKEKLKVIESEFFKKVSK